MPLYEFSCKKCGKAFEELLYNSGLAGVVCPGCGSKKTVKKLSVFGTKKSSASDCVYRESCKKPSCSCGN
ncbi:MAG: zinc ribbon domain-containing protein [Candidatus Firestonebacteria bacterium]|nr:zinc ribbon domain-containing protein [Candidatus Firestonebacteria bacterium]